MNPYWEHISRFLEITVPILLFMWANRRKAKAENEQKAEELAEKERRKHQQNTEKLDTLLEEREYGFVPHCHDDSGPGPLTFEKLRKRPNGRH